jgi:hypothetical protein
MSKFDVQKYLTQALLIRTEYVTLCNRLDACITQASQCPKDTLPTVLKNACDYEYELTGDTKITCQLADDIGFGSDNIPE